MTRLSGLIVDRSVAGIHVGIAAVDRAASVMAERRFWAATALVTAIAIGLRCWRLDLAEFKGDELAQYQLALALAQQSIWPTAGIPSSLGTNNSPLFVYVCALPLLFWASPTAVAALVATLNGAAVGGTVLFGRRYFGPWVGIIAGLSFATAPWAVIFSRKIWEQDLLPPVVLLFFLSLFAVVVDRRPAWLAMAGIAAGLAVQLHPSAVVLPAIGLLAVARWPRRFPARNVAAGMAAGALTLVPYVVLEARTSFADWLTALTHAGTAHISRPVGLALAGLFWAEITSGWQVLGLFARDGFAVHAPLFANVAPALALAGTITAMLFIGRSPAPALPTTTASQRPPSDPTPGRDACVLLLAWLLIPPLLLASSGLMLFPHYFIVLYPAPFLAVGVLVHRWRHAWIVLPAWSLLLLTNVATIWWTFHLAATVPPRGPYGMPLRYSKMAARDIVQSADGQLFTVTADRQMRDGTVVIAQLARWQGGRVATVTQGGYAASRYVVLLPDTVAPRAVTRIATVGPAGGAPVAVVYKTTSSP